MSIAIVKKEEMAPQYDANGFSRMEMLPGTFPGAHNYKCFLKAGHDVQPEKYADKTAVYCFTAGKGYVTTDKFARNITELAFFVPDFDNGDFTIHAVEDLEFLCLVLDMTEGDHKNYAACHTTLPIFRSFSETHEYTQDCKGPHTRSWQVLYSGEVGRNLLGVVKAVGEGTVEKGHPAVDQWNYGLDNADFTLTVENGTMTFHVSLQSQKIVNLYPGMAADAPAHESDWLQPTVDTVTYSDGTSDEVYGFDIPVAAVDADFQLAILGTKGTWYDHTVSVSDAEPAAEDAAAAAVEIPADGSYTCAVTLEGGSGRATVESPAALTVADGIMTATIVWSSPNYDYMLVDGEKYLPVNTDGNSTFEIPVAALDTALAVTADTVAMSTPHEIDYTLTFDSATLAAAE